MIINRQIQDIIQRVDTCIYLGGLIRTGLMVGLIYSLYISVFRPWSGIGNGILMVVVLIWLALSIQARRKASLTATASMSAERETLASDIPAFRQQLELAGWAPKMGLMLMGTGYDPTDACTRVRALGATDEDLVTELEAIGVDQGVSVDVYSALLNASGARDAPNDTFNFSMVGEHVLIVVSDGPAQDDGVDFDDGLTIPELAEQLSVLPIQVWVVGHPDYDSAYLPITQETGGRWFSMGATGDDLSNALDQVRLGITQ